MTKEDVAGIAQLFELKEEIVEGSVKDGTLSTRIKDALAGKVVYAKDEFDKFKKNLAAEANETYFNDLVEKSRKGDIPAELYKNVKGQSLQQKERELSRKYEVSDYSGLDDLIEKAIGKTTANGKQPELEQQIKDLKEANKKLLSDKENAIKDVEAQYRSKALDRDKRDFLSRVPFDLSDKKAEEVEAARQKIQNLLLGVFDADYRLDYDEKGKVVVVDKENKIKKNQATLEPVDPSSVMAELAKEYGLKLISPDRGGQGGQSSRSSGQSFTDINTYLEYCKANNLEPGSKEATKLINKDMLAQWAKRP
jgi:hypothetical protein